MNLDLSWNNLSYSDKIKKINLIFNQFKKKLKLKPIWTLSTDNSKLRCGYCNENHKTIFLSKYYIDSHHTNLKMITNTLLHEIAHAIVGCQHNHNTIWREKALEIGCDGDSKCRMPYFVKPPLILTCENGCFNICRYRKSNLNHRECKNCNCSLLFIKNT